METLSIICYVLATIILFTIHHVGNWLLRKWNDYDHAGSQVLTAAGIAFFTFLWCILTYFMIILF